MKTNNHPAHGPVSLDRLHQIREILSKAAAQSDGGNLGYAMADAVKVIDGAIAAFGAEPVGEVVLGEYDDCGSYPDARVVCIAADGQADWENFKDGTRLYAVNPAQVSIDERAAFNAWNNDENLPIAGVGAKNAAWLAWQARATMLQSFGNSEQLKPLSHGVKLPLDYLQGHKDGLEWAAQLAEANHPQTGDWLYDDPIELAGAIRKGPDMPPVQTASVVDADDNFYSWFGREWEKYYQPNNYSLSAKKHLGAIAESAWFACRAAMLQAGSHTEQNLDMVDHSGDANEKVEPVIKPYKLPFDQWLSQQNEPIDVDCGCVTTEAFYHWLRVAYEASNSPVAPDGYVLVPKEPTAEMINSAMRDNETGGVAEIYDLMITAAPQQEVK